MDENELKKKLRDLKKLETKLRYPDKIEIPVCSLLWFQYFSDKNRIRIRYPLKLLATLSRAARKEIFEEYLYHLYVTIIKERGLNFNNCCDASLLELLGLPFDASPSLVKTRFKELFKKYHPDTGGDHTQIIRLLDLYEHCFPARRI